MSDLGERFALEYIRDLNATQAYLRIKPEVKATSAGVEGFKLLRNPKVATRIQELKAEQADRLKITADRVLQEIAVCAFSDTRDYTVNEMGRFAVTGEAHDLATRAVSSVKHRTVSSGSGDRERTEHSVEYRLWDKVGSLKLLGEHVKLFKGEPIGAGTTVSVMPDGTVKIATVAG